MLFNLEYVISKQVFNNVLQKYFKRFLFQHPYPEDFVRVAEEVSGFDLEWYFEHWLNETGSIDYGISELRQIEKDGQKYAAIKLKRYGRMAMPLDIELQLKDGSVQMLHVPIGLKLYKPLPADWYISHPWFGWGHANQDYYAEVPIGENVKRAVIDPTGKLMDIYRLNNTSDIIPPLNFHYDNMMSYAPSISEYDIHIRPSITWNELDGFNPGVHWFSGYLLDGFVRQFHTDGAIRFRGKSKDPEITLLAETPFLTGSSINHLFIDYRYSGLMKNMTAGVEMKFRHGQQLYPIRRMKVSLQANQLKNSNYIPVWQAWEEGCNRIINFNYSQKTKTTNRDSRYDFDLATSVHGSDFDYTKFTVGVYHEIDSYLPMKIQLYGDRLS